MRYILHIYILQFIYYCQLFNQLLIVFHVKEEFKCFISRIQYAERIKNLSKRNCILRKDIAKIILRFNFNDVEIL